MISSYVLKAAEEKMDALFSAYTERNRQDFDEFMEAVRPLGLYWLLLNQRPPVGKTA